MLQSYLEISRKLLKIVSFVSLVTIKIFKFRLNHATKGVHT